MSAAPPDAPFSAIEARPWADVESLQLDRLRRQVGYLTQAPSVYGDLTTRENLRYFARVLGAPAARVEICAGRTKSSVQVACTVSAYAQF